MPPSFARIRGNLRRLVVISAISTFGLGVLVVMPTPADAATTICSSMSKVVYDRVNPTRQSGHLTLNRAQSDAAAGAGFTSVRDVSMLMASSSASGLAGVHRLYKASTGDYFYTPDAAKVADVVARLGYTDQGVAFFAATTAASCLTPVYSYTKSGRHRVVVLAAERAALIAAGWHSQGIKFYGRQPAVDSKFSIVVMPDTQQEVLRSSDGRFVNRSNWLIANQAKLDPRFVTHTGDVVNWDTADHSQYAIARNALAPLNKAGIPYSLSIGNHDTQATGPGGSARDGARTHALQRDTTVFNAYLGAGKQTTDLEGVYEAGKVDNSFHVFTAGGAGWLVLNLELWPRKGVVNWAAAVVKSHPRHNVIIATHSYLTSTGGISASNGGYGDTSPKYLWDNLVKKYANVRLVFSGHVGQATRRVDHGVHGNRIDSFLTTIHSNSTNPMRLVEIDTKAGTLSTKVYGPWTDETFTKYSAKLSKLKWVN